MADFQSFFPNLSYYDMFFLRIKTERNKKILRGAIAAEVLNKMRTGTSQSD